MLPEFEAVAERLRELKEGRSQDVPIALLTQFIEENPESKVINKLRAILSEWDDVAPLPFDEFLQSRTKAVMKNNSMIGCVNKDSF